MYSFEQTKLGYRNLWDQAQIKDKFHAIAMQTAKRVMEHEDVFKQVEEATDVPWWLVGAWLYRESNIDVNTYLGNGQSLKRVTTEVPAHRGPWNSFLDGAIDAIKYEDGSKGGGFYKIGKGKWTLEYCLWASEVWNGQGYFSHGTNSPYTWSWTNQYTHGKFTTDHGFDPDFVDPQGGVAAILMALFEIDPTLMPARIAKEKTVTTPTTPTVTQPDIATAIHGLETILNFAPTIATFFPPIKPLVPFIPIIQGLLKLAEDLPGVAHDPQAIADLLIKHLQDIVNSVQAAKAQLPPGQNQSTGT